LLDIIYTVDINNLTVKNILCSSNAHDVHAEQFKSDIDNYSKLKRCEGQHKRNVWWTWTTGKVADERKTEIAQRSSMLSTIALDIAILLIIRCNRDCEHCSKDTLARPHHDGTLTVSLARKLRQYTLVKPRQKTPFFSSFCGRWRGPRSGKNVLYACEHRFSSQVYSLPG